MPWGHTERRQYYPEHFEEVAEQIDGEVVGDPARYLVEGDTMLVRARIKGIDNLPTLRAWIGVTNALWQRARLEKSDYWNLLGQLQDRRDDLEAKTGPDSARRPVDLRVVREKRATDREAPASARLKVQQMATDGGDDREECFRCGVPTLPDNLEEFDVPTGADSPEGAHLDPVDLCPPCLDRWQGREFIVAAGGEA